MNKLRVMLAMSFRAKVLVPVITVMVLMLAVMTWIINQQITQMVETEAKRTLTSADEAFRDFQDFRARSLLLRFKDLPKQNYYLAAFQSREASKMREQLDTLLAKQGVDVVLFTSSKQKLIASAKRDLQVSIPEFESAGAPVVKRALQGDAAVDTIRVGEKLYDVVTIPIFEAAQAGYLIGALTLGSEVDSAVAEELGRVTHSQIVLLSSNRVIVSTLPVKDMNEGFVRLFRNLSIQAGKPSSSLRVQKEVIAEEHFFCSARSFAPLNGDSSLGYLLLYSYEQSWRTLQTAQQILFGASLLAILLGSVVVCFLVGKAARPIRQLRDSAEAVGRGDFSRRVEVTTEDECGELARVFNQMTENLKNSHDQLEMTVETLKTTQAQLIQSEKLSGIGEFIAGVAHELNNPLTSVMGFSELLRQDEVDAKHKRFLEMIYKSALRCQKIVQALLSFARRRSPERKPVCVNNLIEAAVEILQYQLRTSNIEAITRLDPQLPQAMVDPHQIQQVFVNIINNARQAIEAHQPKGWIKVTTITQGDAVRIIFQDNGPGITDDNLSKIFDPFFTTKEVGQGTGLGLSLCYGIIKEHGGTITPCSKPGEGAVFIIELPITHETCETAVEKRPPPTEIEPVNPREGKGKKVLVVDDEEPILHMVREALIPRGYEVDIAPDGETGLQQSTRKQYDVMLCDWKMPGLNGRQVYDRLRSTNPILSDRMIFITGDLISEKTRKFLDSQNKICLPKPFSLAEFRAAINKVLAAAETDTTPAVVTEAPAKLPPPTEGKSKK